MDTLLQPPTQTRTRPRISRRVGRWPIPLWHWAVPAVFAVLYLLLSTHVPSPVALFIKSGVTVSLTLITLRTLQDSAGLLLATALIFAFIGDVVNYLDYDTFAAGAFGMYMLTLTGLFILHRFHRPLSIWRIALAIVVLLHCFLLAAIILSSLKDNMMLPFSYIMLMMLFCCAACMTHWDDPSATLGAVLFVMCSTILGLNVFLDVGLSKEVAWISYAAGHILITYGVLKAKRG